MTAASRWRASAGWSCLETEGVDPKAVAARIEERREQLRAEVKRGEGKLGNDGFVAKAPGQRGRRRARELDATRLSWKSWADSPLRRDPPASRGPGLEAEARADAAPVHAARPCRRNRFASIHVVGTNGKTSVTRMTAALLEAHGVTTGAYLSPHIHSWRERVMIRGEPISEEPLFEALERVPEQAAEVADRSAGDEGPVTQYELLTATGVRRLCCGARPVWRDRGGLGGRLDATNVIPSKLTVLTSVGLDHTEWLGETLEEIASEKLAVLPGSHHSDRR